MNVPFDPIKNGGWPNILRRAVFLSFIGLLIASQPAMAKDSDPGMHTVTYDTGRTMNAPENPMRVIAFAPSVTEIVYALGQERRLVGAAAFSDYPDAAKSLPRIGSYVHLDIEKIVSLNPDLCIGIKEGNPLSVVDRLNRLNIPVYLVDPVDFRTMMKSISDIGNLLGCLETANTLTSAMEVRIDAVRTRISGAKYRPGVFFQIGISPIVSAGNGTFIHELIELAGGRNLASGTFIYPRFSKEQVLTLMPEVIVICSMARQGQFEKVKSEWQKWQQLPAVRDNRIFIIDADIVNRPCPRLVEGLEQMAALIHPERFGKPE